MRRDKLDSGRKKFVPQISDSKGITPLVIFEQSTLNHVRYIKEALPVALKYGNKTFGNDWTFQQDGAKPHIHHHTQQWCRDHFPSFIDKDHRSPNDTDFEPIRLFYFG